MLLSGGMDSIAVAYWRRPSLAITIDYGQVPAAGELRSLWRKSRIRLGPGAIEPVH